MVQVVLVQPQIPPNTGNIARTCAATNTELHLVGPLGFELSDRYLKRAGLDYWPHVKLHYHNTFGLFHQHQTQRQGRLIGFDTQGTASYLEFSFQEQDWLLFGSETEGFSPEIWSVCDATVYIPMAESTVRSLNLSVSAALGLYEAYRQLQRWSA